MVVILLIVIMIDCTEESYDDCGKYNDGVSVMIIALLIIIMVLIMVWCWYDGHYSSYHDRDANDGVCVMIINLLIMIIMLIMVMLV